MRKTEILTLLRNGGDYVSGQELCSKLGISRTAVWKIINQLKEEGYEIEAVQNRGYRLLSSPDVISESEVASRLTTGWVGRNLIFHQMTGSTNTDAKQAAEEGAAEGTVVTAERQEAGRGRRGRGWVSPEGCNIYFTLMLRPSCEPEKACMLTLVMALAVAEAVRRQGLDAGIKWPNDIVVRGKKICGILTEMSAEPDYIHHVVIGTGINVNQERFPEDIGNTATSLLIEKGERTERAALLADVLKCFEEYYEIFRQTWDFSGLRHSYEELLVNRNAPVTVLDPKGEYRGTALGINETGELLVKREDGRIENVYAGEVSVRGIYGYV